MSIERDGGTIQLACDDCGELFDEPRPKEEFEPMMAAARAAGWKTFKRGRDWHNCCSSCADDYIEGARQGSLI